MTLSTYHQKYSEKSDEELAKRAEVKNEELAQIFAATPLLSKNNPLRVAVMGCGDKRFVQFHKKYFAERLGKTIELTTFDISIEHLSGEENVIQHDCTLPLPNTPYDITYAHVLLKFIPIEKQWAVLKNSYDALCAGGIAIHVLDTEDYSGAQLADGLYSVQLEKLEENLKQNNIQYTKTVLHVGPNQNIEALALLLIKPLA